jgi:two-component system CheB/CheR fusion protein
MLPPWILLVEDDTVNSQLFQMMIERLGYRVDLADNGQAALEKLAQNTYDLVFMDCQMPVLDGYAATQALRQRESENTQNTHTIVVGLTAYAMTEDRERCLAVGMDDYLTKPLKIHDLSAVLQKWIPSAV